MKTAKKRCSPLESNSLTLAEMPARGLTALEADLKPMEKNLRVAEVALDAVRQLLHRILEK